MTIDANSGLLKWDYPIGALEPYPVQVTAHANSGQSSIEWTVTVRPTYTGVIDTIVESNVSSSITIKGHIIFELQSLPIANAPVMIRVYRNQQLDMAWTVIADADGRFETSYVPRIGYGGEFYAVF
jgi:hypothetical protein